LAVATLNIRLPQAEADIITQYAAQTCRTKSEILREFIRSLEKKLRREAALKELMRLGQEFDAA
jgi:hypothetical protein